MVKSRQALSGIDVEGIDGNPGCIWTTVVPVPSPSGSAYRVYSYREATPMSQWRTPAPSEPRTSPSKMPSVNDAEPAGTETVRLISRPLRVTRLAPATARKRPSTALQLGRQRYPDPKAATVLRTP